MIIIIKSNYNDDLMNSENHDDDYDDCDVFFSINEPCPFYMHLLILLCYIDRSDAPTMPCYQ
jgi:hypothetical protein